MKALSKERERRYETATAFAQDIEHYLHHEPVDGGTAPSAIYRMRRYARKHRGPLAAAAAVVLTSGGRSSGQFLAGGPGDPGSEEIESSQRIPGGSLSQPGPGA